MVKFVHHVWFVGALGPRPGAVGGLVVIGPTDQLDRSERRTPEHRQGQQRNPRHRQGGSGLLNIGG
jgi:hypothetical protein